MSQSTYTVTGMTCGHCVSSVTEEVTQIDGVQVDLSSPCVRPILGTSMSTRWANRATARPPQDRKSGFAV